MIFRLLPALAGLSLAGCIVISRSENYGPPRHEFRTVDREPLDRLRVRLRMGVGHLQAGSGTDKLVSANFVYSISDWKPELNYHAENGQGDLTIEQPSGQDAHLGSRKYEWDVRLARDVPIDMNVHFGVGKAELDLGRLDLNSLEVEMGVGELQLDLRGNPKRDYSVRIRGGVGGATVHLPSDVGVVAEAEGGIGSINAPGMRRNGNRFENEAYGTAKTTVHLDIHGGIGSIRLLTD
jgi:N-terminal domain of toast_rack, DUF2154